MPENLQGGDYTVLGVSLSGPPPIGRLHLELKKGLSVLYGENGVGKTRILTAVQAALTGYSSEGADAVVHIGFHWASVGPQTSFHHAIVAGMRQALTSSYDPQQEEEWELHYQESPSLPFRATFGELVDGFFGLRQELAEDEGDTSAALWGDLARHTHDQGFLTLRAVGTTTPRWELWISDQRSDDSPLARLYERARAFHRYRNEYLKSLRPGDVPTIADIVAAFGGFGVETTALPRAELDFKEDLDHLRPRWAPVEILRAGIVEIGPVLLVEPDVDVTDIDLRTRRLLESNGGLRNEGAPGPALVASAALALEELEAKATRNLSALMVGGWELHVALGEPVDWFRGKLPGWVLRDEHDVDVPLGALSAAQRRWAAAAIELALLEPDHDARPILLLTDEPEAGLHRKAEWRLAAGLDYLSNERQSGGLIATHSPAFLSLRVRRVRVRRDLNRKIEIEDFYGLPGDDNLGLTNADLLALTRVFVVVEGEHDEIVLNNLFGIELGRAQARILVLRGGKRAWSAAHAEWLLAISDAPMLVILDALAEDVVSGHWSEARRRYDAGDRDGAMTVLDELKRINEGEGGFLSSLGREALTLGVLDRIHAAGLSKDDILRYLPGGDQLFARKKQNKLALGEVKEATLQLDEVPDDLGVILERIKRLSAF